MKGSLKGKKAHVITWGAVTAFLVAFLIVLTVLENTLLESIFTTVLGGKKPIKTGEMATYYTSEFNSKEESKKSGDALNVEIASEGFTLLLNEDNALPIKTPESDKSISQKPKVSVFGKNSVNLVLGGSGSGGISGEKAKTLYDGLDKGGYDYNPVLKSFYESSKSGSGRSGNPDLSESSNAAPSLDIGETPIKNYTGDIYSSMTDYNDAAIVVISRLGGESWDLPRTQNIENGGIEDNHYLQLDQNEYDMLDMVTSRFKKVIVVLNTLTSFQCDFIAEYNNTAKNKRIDAVLWIGGPGSTGAEAIGDILNGNVNPSGKTVDLYSADFTKDPTWQNFGNNSQVNDGKNGSAFMQGSTAVSEYMVCYDEGIYIGYRYYETRGYEEKQALATSTWYEDNVIFPFGYGLSYTTFSQEIISCEGTLEDKNSTVTIKVKVTNTGAVAGKDVVQLYVNKPYYYGGIEKSYVELVDFAKTPLLEANGGHCTVTFNVASYDLASYDYNDANENDICGYELEHGDYKFIISANSHVDEYAYGSETKTLDSDLYFEYDTVTGKTKVENLYTTDDFTDLQYRLIDVTIGNSKRKGMSRTNFQATFPTARTEEERKVLSIGEKNELDYINDKTHNNTEIVKVTDENMPKTGESGDMKLKDLLDEYGNALYNDARWDTILDRLTFNEMLDLVNNGAFQTVAIESIGKNLTNDSDGPIGFVNFMNNFYSDNTTFACEIVIGSTWNKDLAYQMGKIVGENGWWGAVKGNGLPYSGWYAPAVNLHRSPFSGRNFEYYSEDPILSGKLAVNVINGAKTKGVYTDLKHFALNDQETNRAGICTFCTEQALRELYLKPFEIAVKGNDNPEEVISAKADGITEFEGTTGIMSSFNRIGTRWTGGDYRLLTQILRNEWGFEGLVICDYKTSNSVMDSRQMLYAGNDLILTSLPDYFWNDADKNSAQDVTILREASKHILYTVANSNSMLFEISGYRMEWWKSLTIALDVIIPVGLAVWGFFAIKGFIKGKKENEAY